MQIILEVDLFIPKIESCSNLKTRAVAGKVQFPESEVADWDENYGTFNS
jgi:hypothetical protein